MHPLPTPDEGLARRLLGPIPYEERLSAGRLVPPVGILREDVRSLPELHLVLTPDERGLAGINLKALAGWVRSTIGDDDLAGLVTQVAGEAGSYAEACRILFDLIGERLDQARRVMGDSA